MAVVGFPVGGAAGLCCRRGPALACCPGGAEQGRCVDAVLEGARRGVAAWREVAAWRRARGVAAWYHRRKKKGGKEKEEKENGEKRKRKGEKEKKK
jgi:hypothetical protein